jgi:hypothetical protein
MREFEFTISDGQVTGESRVNGDTNTPLNIPSDVTFSVGNGAITETVTTDYGTRGLDFTQDASNPSIYDLTNTSFDPSQGAGGWAASGQSGQSHWSGGHGWSSDGDGSGHRWGGGNGLGVSDPGGPMAAPGVSNPGGPIEAAGVSNPGGPMEASGASNPGGPMDPPGVSDPTAAHGPGPAAAPSVSNPGGPMEASGASDPGGPMDPPSLETHIAQMHASGGSLF